MNKQFSAMISAAVLTITCCVSAMPCLAGASEAFHDSGISYAESTETLLNPGMGYTSTVWYNCKPNDTPVLSPTGALALLFIDIGAFSSGVNCQRDENDKNIDGTGTDYPLDDAFFAGLRGTFANARKNGCTLALRFRYDAVGHENPEPATYDKMVSHVMQIKESGLLEEYQDILMYVESGLVGCYGEQWGGKYTDTATKAKLLDLWLDVVPDDIPVTVRTPNIFSAWAGISNSELADWYSEEGSRAARIGLYNDGYMGSSSDLGTYINREIETEWLSHQSVTSYYGGEFSGNLEYTKQFETYLPQNAIPEMYKTHLSYINSNIYSLYQDYTFGAEYDVPNVDNSAYYGENVWKFMRDHLGYRFCLRQSVLNDEVPKGGTLTVSFDVENTGFANPIRKQKAEMILEKDGNYYRTQVDLDSRQWASCTKASNQLKMQLPCGIESGKWNVYLKLSVGENATSEISMRSVRFSNEDTWNATIGANYLGSFSVSDEETGGCDNGFRQINAKNNVSSSDGTLYTYGGICYTDGIISPTESAEERLIAENADGAKLYIWNDEDYFYVSFSLKNKAVSPVYNIQLQNADQDKWYWYYVACNGGTYFNNGSHAGAMVKYTDDAGEFRIPMGDMMGLQPGTNLSYIRVFLQDMSIEKWPSCGEIKSGAVTLQGGFTVYTAERTVYLTEGDSVRLYTETSAKEPTYQWLMNGKEIAGATAQSYSAVEPGSYSVRVTSASGLSQVIPVSKVLAAQQSTALGDLNLDGTVSVADAVLLTKYLLGQMDLHENQAKNADLNGSKTLNAIDLAMLKQVISRAKEN